MLRRSVRPLNYESQGFCAQASLPTSPIPEWQASSLISLTLKMTLEFFRRIEQ